MIDLNYMQTSRILQAYFKDNEHARKEKALKEKVLNKKQETKKI